MANWISILRTILALVAVGLLFLPGMAWVAFWLTVAVIWMDGLDGWVARRLGESSRFGAVLDILCDRIVEQVYWVGFLALGWVPLWVPLVVIIRGVAVDGLRSEALAQGYTAFGSTTMMQHPLGVLLVSSRFSRWTYAVLKAVAFAAVIAAYGVAWPEPLQTAGYRALADGLVWATVLFCVIRGLPVLIEGRRLVQ